MNITVHFPRFEYNIIKKYFTGGIMNNKFCYKYPRPMVTVDSVILCVNNREPSVLLIKRLKNPFENLWALPGGFVEMEEDLEDAALRELKEETGIELDDLYQILTVGTPGRDPRGRTITVVYAGFLSGPFSPKGGSDAKEAKWFSLLKLPGMAFDHNQVLMDVLRKLAEPVNLKQLVREEGCLTIVEDAIKRITTT